MLGAVAMRLPHTIRWGSPFKLTVERTLLVSGWTTILITGSGMSTISFTFLLNQLSFLLFLFAATRATRYIAAAMRNGMK